MSLRLSDGGQRRERDKKIVRSKEDRVDAAAFAAVERPVSYDRCRLHSFQEEMIFLLAFN